MSGRVAPLKWLWVSVGLISILAGAGVVLVFLGLTRYAYLLMLLIFAIPAIRVFGLFPKTFGKGWIRLFVSIWVAALVVVLGIFMALLRLATGQATEAGVWSLLSAGTFTSFLVVWWRWGRRTRMPDGQRPKAQAPP